ncbi:MAG: GAF domain-containing protein [Actinobacteria bacterium]|nr:GAF domain-containing protein [Actinomycetota bacterium]
MQPLPTAPDTATAGPFGERDASLRAHLRRAVDVALTATFLTVAALMVYPSLDGEVVTNLPLYWATLAVALGGAVGIGALPWNAILQRPWRFQVLAVWSALDIVLVTLVVASTGGAKSPMFIIYVLTTIFFAASYPGGAQFALLAFTYGCYLLVALPTAGADVGAIFIRLTILGLTTYMVNFLSKRLMDEMTAHDEARLEASRRADLIATVAAVGRNLNTLDEDRVLEVVAEAALALGFDAADVSVLDESRTRYQPRHGFGLPESYTATTHPTDTGFVAAVLASGATVVLDDSEQLEGRLPAFRDEGFRSVIATPIRVDDEIVATLDAGWRRIETLSGQDIEAFELLATQAGRALENARRFAHERETVERLGQLDQLKSDFLSNVSHELRTPLTVIRGMSTTLRERWEAVPDDSRYDLLSRIDSNAVALDAVLTALLEFSLLQAGTLQSDPTAFDLDEVVTSTVGRVTPLLSQHRVQLHRTGPAVVYADQVLIGRAVENLLTNAGKHTPPGTEVHVEVGVVDGSAEVVVRDTGPGIPAEELPHVLERFYRGGDPNRRTSRGLGLGLALSQEILDLYGSELEVTSDAGIGSTFRFRLPIVTTEGIERSLHETTG